jgi:hypothetical protein
VIVLDAYAIAENNGCVEIGVIDDAARHGGAVRRLVYGRPVSPAGA